MYKATVFMTRLHFNLAKMVAMPDLRLQQKFQCVSQELLSIQMIIPRRVATGEIRRSSGVATFGHVLEMLKTAVPGLGMGVDGVFLLGWLLRLID